jgi:hypothetical protein
VFNSVVFLVSRCSMNICWLNECTMHWISARSILCPSSPCPGPSKAGLHMTSVGSQVLWLLGGLVNGKWGSEGKRWKVFAPLDPRPVRSHVLAMILNRRSSAFSGQPAPLPGSVASLTRLPVRPRSGNSYHRSLFPSLTVFLYPAHTFVISLFIN